jgi:hypothetical protein
MSPQQNNLVGVNFDQTIYQSVPCWNFTDFEGKAATFLNSQVAGMSPSELSTFPATASLFSTRSTSGEFAPIPPRSLR